MMSNRKNFTSRWFDIAGEPAIQAIDRTTYVIYVVLMISSNYFKNEIKVLLRRMFVTVSFIP